MTELGQALGNNVTARFVQLVTTDKQAQALAREALESASYETANRYSVRTGELMGQALADETQTLAYMSYDVAQETLTPLMTANHEAVTAVTNTIQTNMNRAAGVGLAPAPMVLDTSRIDGLSAVVTQCDTMAQAREVIAEPLINSSQSIVDRGIRDNAKANSKAGLTATIVRRTESGGTRTRTQVVRRGNKVYRYQRQYTVPCEWCANLAGVYDYESVKNTGNNVFRRHESCRCTVTYQIGNRRQDVWTKTEWTADDAEEQREAVANSITPNRETPNNDVANKLGADNYRAMTESGANAPELNRKLWDKYEDQIAVQDTHYTGTAHANRSGIYFDISQEISPANGYDKPWQTFRHESAHFIDTLAGRENGTPYHFSAWYNDNVFPKTIKAEVQELVKERGVIIKQLIAAGDLQGLADIGAISTYDITAYERYPHLLKYSKDMAYKALQREIRQLPASARCDLSDILEGATNGKVQCGFGHPSGHWRERTYNGVADGLATEAFAEMNDSAFASPESWAAINKYLPKSVAVFNEMLEVLTR